MKKIIIIAVIILAIHLKYGRASASHQYIPKPIPIPHKSKMFSESQSRSIKRIINIAKANNLDSNLLLAVAYYESSFNQKAKSKKGAIGTFQIMPKYWAKECNTTANGLYDLDTNILCGMQVLDYFIKKANGDLRLGLCYYNGGTKNNSKCQRGAQYADRIIKLYEIL